MDSNEAKSSNQDDLIQNEEEKFYEAWRSMEPSEDRVGQVYVQELKNPLSSGPESN